MSGFLYVDEFLSDSNVELVNCGGHPPVLGSVGITPKGFGVIGIPKFYTPRSGGMIVAPGVVRLHKGIRVGWRFKVVNSHGGIVMGLLNSKGDGTAGSACASDTMVGFVIPSNDKMRLRARNLGTDSDTGTYQISHGTWYFAEMKMTGDKDIGGKLYDEDMNQVLSFTMLNPAGCPGLGVELFVGFGATGANDSSVGTIAYVDTLRVERNNTDIIW